MNTGFSLKLAVEAFFINVFDRVCKCSVLGFISGLFSLNAFYTLVFIIDKKFSSKNSTPKVLLEASSDILLAIAKCSRHVSLQFEG